MDFWLHYMLWKDNATLYPAVSINNMPDREASMGSLFLSRVMYGASAACRALNTQSYKILADMAFKTLYEKFRNPAGGFYWARSSNNQLIHDIENTNMAQAFVLYGLSEYVQLTGNPIVEGEMKKLQLFITNNITDKTNGGFLDGYSADWKQSQNFNKALATHLHLMEAFVKQYQFTGDKHLAAQIGGLIEIIADRFIDSSHTQCFHRLTPDWGPLPDFNWAGHNAEVGWLLTWASYTIKNEHLHQRCSKIAKSLTEKVIEQAFDKSYGGVFNDLKEGQPTEDHKIWWPQAEAALACMNAYICTKDKTFLSYGLRLIEYIENTFSDPASGEWYSTVSREGRPIESEPKVHFWKSLYHNVRYCIEMRNMVKSLVK